MNLKQIRAHIANWWNGDVKYVDHVSHFGTSRSPRSRGERFTDQLFLWIGRVITAVIVLVIIGLIFGWYISCAPYLTKPMLEAPLMCLSH